MRKRIRMLSIIICLCLILVSISACSKSQNSNSPTPEPSQNDSMPESQESGSKNDEPSNIVAEGAGDAVVQAILKSYSTKQFVAGEVSDDDLQKILQSGAKAPSARNMQPWHFTVVSGNKVTQMIKQSAEGNVLIIISGSDDNGEGMNVDYDCGLASAYLYLAAQSLGYGAHIYMGGVSGINESRRDELQIPNGYSAIMMMLIGNIPDNVDAVSSATQRNPLDEIVTYIE